MKGSESLEVPIYPNKAKLLTTQTIGRSLCHGIVQHLPIIEKMEEDPQIYIDLQDS